MFSSYPTSQGIVDEYTLSQYLGKSAASELEKHYSAFINRESFQQMQDAGFDHVRISFPYWLIANVNSNDPYVEKVGWRYLLRGIEWAREYGLRINICLHAAPGSQNGLYHRYSLYWSLCWSQAVTRVALAGWMGRILFDCVANISTDGTANAQATTVFTGQLAAFFSQPRYKNLVTMVKRPPIKRWHPSIRYSMNQTWFD